MINRNLYRAQQESSIVYQYDAFVAYHKDNLAWVRNQLFEHLGGKETDTDDVDKSRFRLCIHDLNFVPGISIEENIIKGHRKQSEDHTRAEQELPQKWMVRVRTPDGQNGEHQQRKEHSGSCHAGITPSCGDVEQFEAVDSEKYLHRMV